MGEAVGGTQEARGEQHELPARRLGVDLAFELVLDDLLDAAGVEQLEVHGPPAGSVDALAAVLVRQAQELLGLSQLGPGEVAREQLLEEAPDVLAWRRPSRITASGSRRA